MPYSDLLSRGFEVVRRNRALWIMGMIYAFLGGGGGGGASFNQNFSSSDMGTGNAPQIPSWLTAEFIVSVAVVVGIIIILLSILFFVLRVTAFTGLVHGTQQALTSEVGSVRSLWGAGWSSRGRRVMGLQLLLAIPSIILAIIGIIALAVTAVPLFMAAIQDNNFDESAMAPILSSFFAGICVFICVAFFIVVIQIALNMAGNYASRFIIVEDQSIGNGWRQGWAMFRTHLLESLVMAFILFVINVVIGFLIAIPTTILALAIVVPFAISGGFENLLTIPVPLLVIGGIFGGLLIALVSSILVGPVLAYRETVWTLVYRHYRGLEIAAPDSASAPTMV